VIVHELLSINIKLMILF